MRWTPKKRLRKSGKGDLEGTPEEEVTPGTISVWEGSPAREAGSRSETLAQGAFDEQRARTPTDMEDMWAAIMELKNATKEQFESPGSGNYMGMGGKDA